MQNRNKANIILAVVFVLFVIATVLKLIYRNNYWAGMAAFTAEAALIGGIADWFAVTALFKKPLGISWHTEIVPRNREQIIEKVSQMVGQELLSQDSIRTWIAGLKPADRLLDWFFENSGKPVLEDFFKKYFSENPGKTDWSSAEDAAAAIDGFINEYLKKEDVAEELFNSLKNSIKMGKHKEWLGKLAGKAAELAGKPSVRERIYRILLRNETYGNESRGVDFFFIKILIKVAKSSSHTNLLSLSSLIQQQLVSILKQMEIPGNAVVDKIADSISDWTKCEEKSEMLKNAIQVWKNGIITRISLNESLKNLILSIVQSDNLRNETALWVSGHLDDYFRLMQEDEGMREWTNSAISGMLSKILLNEHHYVDEIARETLMSFTDEMLIKFIEDKAGNDLQWIRINCSVVGAAAGLIIYVFATLIYGPYVAPVIRSIVM